VTFIGTFNWSGGTLSGNPLTVASNGVLNVSGSGVTLGGALTSAGTVNWLSGDVQVYNYTPGVAYPVVNLAGGLWNIQ